VNPPAGETSPADSPLHSSTPKAKEGTSVTTNILEMRSITKTFPGVKALANVSLDVARGDVHAICGENGAGKSTLMKVLSGVYPTAHTRATLSSKMRSWNFATFVTPKPRAS
jgi:ABC-type sugar transport system ATPase subunit